MNDPYAAFGTPVDRPSDEQPPLASGGPSDEQPPLAPAGYEAFAAPVMPDGGNWGEPVEAVQPAEMSQNEWRFEIEQALRRGEPVEAIVQRLGAVQQRDAEPGAVMSFTDPDQLRAAAAYYRTGGTAPLQWDSRFVGADGEESTATGAAARGLGDTLTFNYLDELEAILETGKVSGEEYEEAWRRRQQRRQVDRLSQAGARTTGQILGLGAQMLVPGGALSRVAGMGRQALTGAGVGAGMNVLSGSGSNAPGERTATVLPDAALGAAGGAAAAPLAYGARRVVQSIPEGFLGPLAPKVQRSAADDALEASGLDPDDLRQRADQFRASTGRGARISDILTPEEAMRFTAPLSRSSAAKGRVYEEIQDSRAGLPGSLEDRIRRQEGADLSADEVRRRASDLADEEFGAISGQRIGFDEDGVEFMLREVLPYVNLPALTRREIRKALGNNGSLSVEQMDAMRRALQKTSGASPGGVPYARMAGDIETLVSSRVPEYGTAIENMAKRLAVADGGDPRYVGGMDLGRAAVGQMPTTDALQAIGRQTNEGMQGVRYGARSGLLNEALESPGRAYALARRAQQDPGFAERLRAAVPEDEADEFIEFATRQKEAIDSLAAMARIPSDKIETLLDSAEEMTDAIAAAGLGGGGAFKASVINSMLARLNIGEGAADRLASDLLDPARKDEVFRILEAAGIPKRGVREMVQSAFIAAANAVATGNRVPEGVPAPMEISTMGVPPQ